MFKDFCKCHSPDKTTWCMGFSCTIVTFTMCGHNIKLRYCTALRVRLTQCTPGRLNFEIYNTDGCTLRRSVTKLTCWWWIKVITDCCAFWIYAPRVAVTATVKGCVATHSKISYSQCCCDAVCSSAIAYRVAQKVSHYWIINKFYYIILKPDNKNNFVILKYQLSNCQSCAMILLSFSFKYSICDLMRDVSYCVWAAKLRYRSNKRSFLHQLALAIYHSSCKPSFKWKIIKNFVFTLFYFFRVFKTILSHAHLSYPRRSFKHSNWWRHKLDHA